jgi:hypothetical protein
MSDIRVARGNSPIEQQAINARLSRLGLEVDNDTRTIKPESLAKIAGGQQAIEALLNGKSELDLDALAQLKTVASPTQQRHGEKIRAMAGGKVPADVAAALLKSLPLAMNAATDDMGRFNTWFERQGDNLPRGEFIQKLEQVMRRVNHAASEFDKLKSSGALGFADSAALGTIKEAYAGLLKAAGRYGARLDQIYKDTFEPMTTSTWTNLKDSGLTAMARMYAPGQHAKLAGSVATILGNDKLFESFVPTAQDIRACLDARIIGPRGSFSPLVEQYTAAVALNTVQHLFTNEFGNDVQLKLLVQEKQRENPYTMRALALEDAVHDGRPVRTRQIDALFALLHLFPGPDAAELQKEIQKKLASMAQPSSTF